MAVAELEIAQVADNIWKSVLGLDLTASAGPVPDPQVEKHMAACVQINGSWNGAVELSCTAVLARSCAAAMFQAEPASISEDEVRDGFGELANMVGGGIKALLSGSASLSPPMVVTGQNYVVSLPGSSIASRAVRDCGGSPITVTLYQRS